MLNTLYYTAKAVEYTSLRLGLGKFEVGKTWKCRECLHDETDLCTDCKESWLHELANLEYSDAFERRLNNTAGTAGCMMGITGALANASMGFWEEGDVMKQITEVVKARLSDLFLLSPAWRTIYNYVLILIFVLSISMILACALVATFIVAMNPGAKRHWRHMTPGVYLVLFSQFLVYTFLLVSGVTMAELAFAFVPVVIGAGALLCVLFMRKSQDGCKVGDIEKTW